MHITQSLPLEATELPLRAETFSMSMIWHERAHGDPAQIWLRQQIIELSK
jgi:hypothetical protein